MGLLDFDDREILKNAGIMKADDSKYRRRRAEVEMENNFTELQNLGHHEQSADFSDSPHADRIPLKEEEQV